MTAGHTKVKLIVESNLFFRHQAISNPMFANTHSLHTTVKNDALPASQTAFFFFKISESERKTSALIKLLKWSV